VRITRLTLAVALVFGAVEMLPARTPAPDASVSIAQQGGQRVGGPPQAQPPAGQRGQRGGGGGGRGGGRGRGGVQVMTLTAPWAPGAAIPIKYTQAGDEISPALSWDDPPDGTASFVLIVHDASAPIGQGNDDVLHWMVWNIPGDARSLPEGVAQGPQREDGSRQISVTGPYYRGPAAPASGPVHVYLFELYALDATINVAPVAPVGVPVSRTRADVMEAMAGHIRGKAVTAGTFKRQ